MPTSNTFLNWSSGKDSAYTLHLLQQDPQFEVKTLLTTVTEEYQRVSMHGLRRELLQAQADKVGLALREIVLPPGYDMDTYDQKVGEALADLKDQGLSLSAYGDIFLEDLRQYRESFMTAQGFTCLFPLWQQDTRKLYLEMLKVGLKAITVCVDGNVLDESFVGRVLDEQFLQDLPEGIDPCGENGEFHTFVYDGPMFSGPVPFEQGERRKQVFPNQHEQGPREFVYWYCDLLPQAK